MPQHGSCLISRLESRFQPDAEVWLTTDGGKENSNWIPYRQGLPHSAVLQLKMSTQGKQMLVAATHGRGVWSVPTRQ